MIGIPILFIFISLSKVNKTAPLQLLQSFWLHKNNEDFFQYKFVCSEAADSQQAFAAKEAYWIMNAFTLVDENTKDIVNLSKQEVRCPKGDFCYDKN